MRTSVRRSLGAALLVGAFLAVAGAGCGGDESAATQQCEVLGDKLCDRFEVCQPGAGSQCRDSLDANLGCGDAKAVSATYDQCLAELDTADCTALLAGTLPDSCHGAILK